MDCQYAVVHLILFIVKQLTQLTVHRDIVKSLANPWFVIIDA